LGFVKLDSDSAINHIMCTFAYIASEVYSGRRAQKTTTVGVGPALLQHFNMFKELAAGSNQSRLAARIFLE
jgi:hypothetical protein